MASDVSPAQGADWLLENGPRELESLFRAIVFHPSVPVLIADNERTCQEASAGAGKLLKLSRDQIVGHRIDDFVDPASRPRISELWRVFLRQGEQEGTLRLTGPDGTHWDAEYTAKGNVLPVRHLLVLHDKTPAESPGASENAEEEIPSWVQDYALFLLDSDGRIAAWYSGAARIYGYSEDEAVGKHVSLLSPGDERPGAEPRQELSRSADEGHFGNEGWHLRRDGSRFWANAITMALRDDRGELRGFARVVRDFSDRHEIDRETAAQPRAAPSASSRVDHCRRRLRRVRSSPRSQRRVPRVSRLQS